MMQPCIVCGNRRATFEVSQSPLASGFNCPRCGNFRLIDAAIDRLRELIADGTIHASMFSHQLRVLYEERKHEIVLSLTDLAAYLPGQTAPSPQEQINRLILWVGGSQGGRPHVWVTSQLERVAAIIGSEPTGDGTNEDGLQWIFRELRKRQLLIETNLKGHQPDNAILETESQADGSLGLRLLLQGWRVYEELRRSVANASVAFMAMKFGVPALDRVLRDCFKPAVERAGFTLRPLNELQPAGLIDNQIRVAIRSGRFVVADLTHDNNGAYFEAGLAEGMGRPVIYTCNAEKFHKEKTHFDTNHLVTILWDESNLQDAADKLTATIRWTLARTDQVHPET